MFDLNKMIPMNNSSEHFLFSPSEQNTLNHDIIGINKILSNNNDIYRIVPHCSIPKLNYEIDEEFKGPCNYTRLSILPLTPTGKQPKYKYMVRFATFKGNYIKEWGNDTFGEIYYLQSGKIGKVRIIFWRDKLLTVIHLKLSDNGDLIINKIENK